MPLSSRTCAVWIIWKTLHVLAPGSLDDSSGPGTRTVCQQTVAQSHSSPVTSVKNSAYAVYWVREQSSMSCRETEEHCFNDVIQNRAHIAWQASSMVKQATKSPAYYQLFSRNHASQEKTKTNTYVCIHKVPLRSDYWQLVIGNSLLNLSIRLWENSFTFDRCVVSVPSSGPTDWRCLCCSQTQRFNNGPDISGPPEAHFFNNNFDFLIFACFFLDDEYPVKSPTKILPGGKKKIPPVWKIAHQKYVRWDFFPSKFVTRFIPEQSLWFSVYQVVTLQQPDYQWLAKKPTSQNIIIHVIVIIIIIIIVIHHYIIIHITKMHMSI